MKLSQKTKYIALGVVGTVIAVPLVLRATDAVPLTFRQGDVLSAEVLNSIFSRINESTSQLAADDLLGTWTMIQYMPYNGQPGNGSCRTTNSCSISGTTDSSDQLTRTRTGTAEFSKSGSTYIFKTTGNIAVFAAPASAYNENGNYSVVAETVIFKEGVAQGFFVGRKKSASQIVLQDMQPASNSFNLVLLSKRNMVPLPPTELTATVSGSNIVLGWTDKSSDESGFKVQTKTTVRGTWSTLTTTAAGAVTYTATPGSGNNWYRVLATNSNGDSITSNEVLVEVSNTSTTTSTTR